MYCSIVIGVEGSLLQFDHCFCESYAGLCHVSAKMGVNERTSRPTPAADPAPPRCPSARLSGLISAIGKSASISPGNATRNPHDADKHMTGFSHRHRFDGEAPIPNPTGAWSMTIIGRTVDFERPARAACFCTSTSSKSRSFPKHLERPQDERRPLDRRIARRVHDPRPAVTFWRMHRYRFNIHAAVGEKFSPPDIPAQLRIEIRMPRSAFGRISERKLPTLVILF